MSLSKVLASAGVAVAGQVAQNRERLQISVRPISTTGTVTITVRPSGLQSYEGITDGTINLASPTTLIIEGSIDGVTATSSGNEFELIVVG